jgi:hypothetical protein
MAGGGLLGLSRIFKEFHGEHRKDQQHPFHQTYYSLVQNQSYQSGACLSLRSIFDKIEEL